MRIILLMQRSQYSRLMLNIAKCRDFGECTYRLLREPAEADKHKIVEHEHILTELQQTASPKEKDERLKAIHALRYARMRKEGLVDWQFDISRVEAERSYKLGTPTNTEVFCELLRWKNFSVAGTVSTTVAKA